jgi:hypothetical protein
MLIDSAHSNQRQISETPMRKYTTPPPPIKITDFVPELAAYASTTVRLHPHPLDSDLPPGDSKIGGTVLWPAAEPWPMCADENVPYVAVVQLRKEDFPEVEFYPGTDLFQLLWTPRRDYSTDVPRPKSFWRSTTRIHEPMRQIPRLSDYRIDLKDHDVSDNLPINCSIHPEKVIEYPVPDHLYWLAGPEKHKEILEKIGQSELPIPKEYPYSNTTPIEDTRRSYYWSNLAECPGAKVTGGGSVVEDGKKWDHLMTLSSWEYDSGSYLRWQPLEDRTEITGKPLRDMIEPLGMNFGRTQRLGIWICRDLPDWPIRMFVCE